MVVENALIRFLDAVSNTPVPELVTTYGRRGRPRLKAAAGRKD